MLASWPQLAHRTRLGMYHNRIGISGAVALAASPYLTGHGMSNACCTACRSPGRISPNSSSGEKR